MELRNYYMLKDKTIYMYETYRGTKGGSDVIQNLAWWYDDMDSIHRPELLPSARQTVFC